MILLTAVIVLAAFGFLTRRLWVNLRRQYARPAIYWLDAIEGSSSTIISESPGR
jgi:hypothetical protein